MLASLIFTTCDDGDPTRHESLFCLEKKKGKKGQNKEKNGKKKEVCVGIEPTTDALLARRSAD